jgi:alpha-beta hydrolase superfamily lysophospholipase
VKVLTFLAVLLVAPPALAAGRPVTFVAADGTTLAGMFYESSPRPAPAVVLVHMLGRSKEEWSVVADRLATVGIASLAIDLRGHGRSGGDRSALAPMVGDVRAALDWLATQPAVRPDGLGVVGASLGATLAAAAGAEVDAVRVFAMISPSLDYRGLRLDASLVRQIGARPIWMAASTEDPYALRTIKELTEAGAAGEQRLSGVRGHGTTLLWADPDLARGLVDWLRRTLIF